MLSRFFFVKIYNACENGLAVTREVADTHIGVVMTINLFVQGIHDEQVYKRIYMQRRIY